MVELTESIPRQAEGVPCPCGGYADRVEVTDEENARYNCMRSPRSCCSRAFVCRLCKQRLVGQAEAPEME